MPIQARKKLPKNNNPKAESKNVSVLENFTTRADSIPSCCKLCKKGRHPMSRCSTYASAQTRQARCRELNICTLCTTTRHKTKDCLGKWNRLSFKCSLCNSRNHVTPLCDKAEEKKNSALSINVFNSSRTVNQPFILPMVSLSVSKSRQKHNVNCLLDTGGQRSYFSKGVAEKLKCQKHSFTPGNYEVSTFLGTRKKRLEEVVLGIQADKDRTFHLPVLVDEVFDINLNIDHFGEVNKNLKNLKYELAFTDNGSDQIRVHGLIGFDIIQFMDMNIIKCMNGIAWEFPTGIAPLGNSHHFLYQEQIARARARKSAPENNYQTIITDYSSCPKERVNFVLTPPPKTCPDAFSECFNERTQDARYAKKKKKIKFKSQKNVQRNMITYFEQLEYIAILLAFSSGGNV